MKIKALVFSNGELQEKEIENTLESLQEIVGGYIESPYISNIFRENDIDIIINEEGKILTLQEEIAVIDKEKAIVIDVLCGNCIFVSHNEQGETIGLNDEQIKIIKKELNYVVNLSKINEETGNIENIDMRALLV